MLYIKLHKKLNNIDNVFVCVFCTNVKKFKDPITYRIKIMIHRDNRADKRGYHC